MGDLYVLLETKARPGDVVAIIDGLFEQVGAVWHKEILRALAAGIHVFGASSMGALRAAELHQFGMAGVGRIFEAYRDGILTDDDEVAVSHAPAEGHYRSLSVAMASLRFALEDMRDAGTLPPSECNALLAFAKSLPYAERSWGALVQYVTEREAPPYIIDALRAEAKKPDAKARDAKQLLCALAAMDGQADEPFVADFCFNRTAFWAMLEYEMYPRLATPDPQDEPDMALLDAIRAHSPHRRQIEEEAAILALAARRSASWQPDHAALRAAAANITHRHRLMDKEALHAWRNEHGINDRAWSRLVTLEARRDWLMADLRPGLAPYLTIASRRAGLAAEIADEIDSVSDRGMDGQQIKTSLEEDDIDLAVLQTWYVARCGPMLPDPESHAQALGFATLRDFVTAILPAFLASKQKQSQAD
jgi:hypothetical protein